MLLFLILILILLLSNAIALRRDISRFFSRVATISLAYCILFAITSLYFIPMNIGLHGYGLNITNITQVFYIFIFFISILILQLTNFYPRKVWIDDYSSLKYLILKKIYNFAAIINKRGEQLQFKIPSILTTLIAIIAKSKSKLNKIFKHEYIKIIPVLYPKFYPYIIQVLGYLDLKLILRRGLYNPRDIFKFILKKLLYGSIHKFLFKVYNYYKIKVSRYIFINYYYIFENFLTNYNKYGFISAWSRLILDLWGVLIIPNTGTILFIFLLNLIFNICPFPFIIICNSDSEITGIILNLLNLSSCLIITLGLSYCLAKESEYLRKNHKRLYISLIILLTIVKIILVIFIIYYLNNLILCIINSLARYLSEYIVKMMQKISDDLLRQHGWGGSGEPGGGMPPEKPGGGPPEPGPGHYIHKEDKGKKRKHDETSDYDSEEREVDKKERERERRNARRRVSNMTEDQIMAQRDKAKKDRNNRTEIQKMAVSKYNQKYYANNKEEIKEQLHLDKEELELSIELKKENKKNYQQKNKDKINEKRRERYQKDKATITQEELDLRREKDRVRKARERKDKKIKEQQG